VTTSEWDIDVQQAATRYTVAQLVLEGKIDQNTVIELELFFIPDQNPDPDTLCKALKSFGYTVVAEQETIKGGSTRTAILVTVAKLNFSADDIWLHEERTTKIALTRGYIPDGWGFLEP